MPRLERECEVTDLATSLPLAGRLYEQKKPQNP